IAAKQAGLVWPGELYSWVSLHPDWMMDYAAERRANGYPDAREIVSHEKRPGITRVVNHRWPEQAGGRSGASGMFAVKVAIEAGFERVVLAGIPMEPHIDRIDGRKRWYSARRYQEGIRP